MRSFQSWLADGYKFVSHECQNSRLEAVFRIEFKDNVSYFFMKYVETRHKNRLREMVLMSDHKMF